jgi:hypothetical protein
MILVGGAYLIKVVHGRYVIKIEVGEYCEIAHFFYRV